MLSLRRPSPRDLERIAREQSTEDVTYDGVGGTLTGSPPPGFALQRFERRLGRGATFASANEALRRWQAHRGSGMELFADGPITEGTVVAIAAPLPVGYAIATCRIVAVIDDADRFGFAYGTLPEHPASGEELFVVERVGDDVVFRVTVFSRPSQAVVRAVAPIARELQKRATIRYLDAMQRATTGV